MKIRATPDSSISPKTSVNPKTSATSHPEDVARLKSLWKDWNKSNIDPVFKGLIHTPAWQKKREQAARKKAEAENK
jgi:hypothetical protein